MTIGVVYTLSQIDFIKWPYHIIHKSQNIPYALDIKTMINYSDEHIFDTTLDTGIGDLCIGGGLSSGLYVSTNQ